eukprot:g1421.t1
MNGVELLVERVVDQCAERGVPDVSDTLAAMVAQSVVFDNERTFSMNKKLSDDSLKTLVRLTVERICKEDSPSLETIKMQVAFDLMSTSVKKLSTEEKMTRSEGIAELRRAIVTTKIPSRDAFEKLTMTYRQIFSFVMFGIEYLVDPQKRRTAESEVATALESVFPRVTLKSFIALGNEEKRAQLAELLNIVLGILLFNRYLGKGGAFLIDLPRVVSDLSDKLKRQLEACIRNCLQQSEEYVSVLRYVHKDSSASKANEGQIDRWRRELTNRRQLSVYAEAILKDSKTSTLNIKSSIRTIDREMSSLSDIVGNQHSVAKDIVYPKFDALARNWLALSDELGEVRGCNTVWNATSPFLSSFSRRLSPSLLSSAAKVSLSDSERKKFAGRHVESLSSHVPETITTESSHKVSLEGEGGATTGSEATAAGSTVATEMKRVDTFSTDGGVAAKVTHLTAEDTADIEHLPISLNGFCPVTVVEGRGLLLRGHVADNGVVRFRNNFFSFENGRALHDFMRRPEFYVNEIKSLSSLQPELIEMLNLESLFPGIKSVQFYSRKSSKVNGGGVHPLLARGEPKSKDAGTSTPTHFVEKHIDYKYRWNAWDVRRDIIRVANIRKSKTHSSQTNASHFRQHVDTQVYLPRETATQTLVETGTNPPRSRNYIVGLRGEPGGTKFSRQDKGGSLRSAGARVVNLTFEL